MQCKRWDTNFEKNKHKAQPIYDTIQIESVNLTKKTSVCLIQHINWADSHRASYPKHRSENGSIHISREHWRHAHFRHGSGIANVSSTINFILNQLLIFYCCESKRIPHQPILKHSLTC